MAAVLAECHQEIVDGHPEIPGQDLVEGAFGLLRGFRFHQPETVRDAVDMGVDADRGNTEAETEHQVGGLSTDPG